MRQGAAGWSHGGGEAMALALRSLRRPEGVYLAAGLLLFALVPGTAGAALGLAAFAALVLVSPYVSLLALLGTLPLHFVLRRPVGPVDLSLPDTVLLACVLGLLAGVYWRGLLGGSGALLRPVRVAARSPYVWPALLLVVVSTLTLALLPPQSGQGLKVGLRAYSLIVEPLAVYALVLLGVRDRARLWLLFDVLFAGAVVVAGYGLLEAARVAASPSPEVGGYYRVSSLFNHPNTLALYLSRVLPLFAALAVALPGGRRRRAYALGAALMGVAMLLSGSRGGWIAVAAAALPIALLGRSYKWLAPSAAAGVVGLGLLALSGQDRVTALLRPGRGSADTRERLWRAALEKIAESPVWGSGLGNVSWMRRYIPRKRLTGTELVDAHNLFLDFWAKLGLLGLAAILWLVARYYVLTLRAYRRAQGEARAVAVALVAAMTGAVVHGLVDAFYFGLPLAVFFWLLLGLAEVVAAEGGE